MIGERTRYRKSVEINMEMTFGRRDDACGRKILGSIILCLGGTELESS